MKKAVVLVRACPYGMASAAEAYRAVSAFAGLDLDTTAALMHDGVYVALMGQDPSGIAMSNLEQAYGALSEFGAKVVVHRESLEARGVAADTLMEFDVVNDEGLRALLDDADIVLSF